jgi:hypothetical protein
MRKGYLATYAKVLLIIIFIVGIALGVYYFLKDKYGSEQLKTIKTDMLLIEGKTKIIAQKVKIKEKNASYIGKKISDITQETDDIKFLQEQGIIDIKGKNTNYYVLDKSNLEELGLQTIKLEEGCYIVEYNKNEIIYSKGVTGADGTTKYKLSELQNN